MRFKQKDMLQGPGPADHYHQFKFKGNEKAMHDDIATTGKEMMEAAGFKDVVVRGKISFPGNANHEMGIARMGHDPKTSVLNKYNQMHEVSNVFITDGSYMPSGSCLNLSLTYMALTARACDYAMQEMRRLNFSVVAGSSAIFK